MKSTFWQAPGHSLRRAPMDPRIPGPRLDALPSAPSPVPAGLVPGTPASLRAEDNASGRGVSSGFRWMSAVTGLLLG